MTEPIESTPAISLAEQGFAMPVEWHPHTATWAAWPHNPKTWPKNLEAAQEEFLELVAAIADDEPVMLMCSGEAQVDQFLSINSRRSTKLTNVKIVDIPTNDAWARDYAPTFLVNGETNELLGLDWRYNAWGGKYPPFDLDQQASKRICDHIVKVKPELGPGCSHHKMDFCIEGGAIEMGTGGMVLCTKSCALAPNRNRKVTEAGIERMFFDHLAATSVVWLAGDAITGDDTDGHIDQLARCTPGGAILYAWFDDDADPQHALLEGNLADLKRGLELLGKDNDLVPLPIPDPITLEGQRLPASYCNFYITNKKVIVPQFGQPTDQDAIRIIAEQFPDRDTIGLNSANIAYGQGSFHCLTKQQPQVVQEVFEAQAT